MQHKKRARDSNLNSCDRQHYTVLQLLLFSLLLVCTLIVPLYLAREVAWSEDDHSIHRVRRMNNNNKNARILQDKKNDFEWYSHLPTSKTPALIGANKGKIKNCNENVNDLVYWNDPQGTQDIKFQSPFITTNSTTTLTKYVTFEFPTGGWNNIRMAIEIIFIFAAVTNRTIVLPPKQDIYLLKTKHHLDFTDFFALDRFMNNNNTNTNNNKVLTIISAEEFINRECHYKNGRFPIPEEKWNVIESISKVCENRKKSDKFCGILFQHVMEFARNPYWRDRQDCVVFDENAYHGKPVTQSSKDKAKEFCKGREEQYYKESFDDTSIIHFATTDLKYRLLDHFYFIFLFTNPKIHYHYHRFIRDHLHYNDLIYCAAGKIIHALQKESMDKGFIRTNPIITTTNDHSSYNRNIQEAQNNNGNVNASPTPVSFYSSLHVRRGDLQYKFVKIPAEEWYENTKDIFFPKEVLYIATDETNRSFFDPLTNHYTIRFLDDYQNIFNPDNAIESVYYGMIDTIVASYGRQFVGTSFSTFTNYINRVRGYRGFSMNSSWYGTLNEKNNMHIWDDEAILKNPPFTREFPDGWIRIDGDEFITKTNY